VADPLIEAASVLLLTVVIALITEKMIEPRLGAYIGERPVEEGSGMSPEESRGLRYATYGLVGVIVFFALLTLPPGAPLRNPETGAIIGNSPLMNGLIVAITVLFLVMGMAYDIGAETMKNSADVIGAMTKAVGSLSGLIFLLLIISQFLAYFNYSNMATIAAVKMAPVALAIADDLQASPYPFAMIVALAASTAFMTPISSPVNMLVVAPGNYTFGDFVRIGVPFAVIVMVVSVILVPWLLPFY
jgi:aminobenzoyl-glutamate transport protein